jgi:hypothetical protein
MGGLAVKELLNQSSILIHLYSCILCHLHSSFLYVISVEISLIQSSQLSYIEFSNLLLVNFDSNKHQSLIPEYRDRRRAVTGVRIRSDRCPCCSCCGSPSSIPHISVHVVCCLEDGHGPGSGPVFSF